MSVLEKVSGSEEYEFIRQINNSGRYNTANWYGFSVSEFANVNNIYET